MAWKLPALVEKSTKLTKAWVEELRTKFEESVTEILLGYATTSELALKAPLASPALTGEPKAPTATTGTANQQIASTAFVRNTLEASPTLAGTPKAPTAAEGTNTEQIATTAFVETAVAGAGGGGVGSWTAPTSLGTGVQQASGYKAVEARTENGGATARLKGAVEVEALKELKANATILTLPAAFHPNVDHAAFVGYAGTGAYLFVLSTGGILTCTANLPAVSTIFLENMTWSLT